MSTPQQQLSPSLESPDTGLEAITDDLAREFAGTFTRETIDRFVVECRGMVAALILPVPGEHVRPSPRMSARVAGLTRRFAAERLEALAQSDGRRPKQVPEVLFVCVHDGGRSQLAALLLQHLSGGRVHVRSAGSAPAAAVHPSVGEVLGEIGLDASLAYPKPLTDEAVRAADVVITLGCGDSCPIIPDKRYEDWDVADPTVGLAEARAVRDDLATRARGLLGSLGLQD